MPATVTTQDAERVVFNGLAEVGAEEDSISRDATFEQLDVDSLDLVEVAQVVEDELGVELRADDVKELRTVGDTIDLIVAKADSG
jgi:acyl carrier protein